jgi:hypothetical protein
VTSSYPVLRPQSLPDAFPCPKCGDEPVWTKDGFGCACQVASFGVYLPGLEEWNDYARPTFDGDATQVVGPPTWTFDPCAVVESFKANADRERKLSGRATPLADFLNVHQPPLTSEQRRAVVAQYVKDGVW